MEHAFVIRVAIVSGLSGVSDSSHVISVANQKHVAKYGESSYTCLNEKTAVSDGGAVRRRSFMRLYVPGLRQRR